MKAVRGTDRLVVAKWEKRGWELVDQTPGIARTDLTFRRPKPPMTRKTLATGALVVAIAIALAGVITVGALTEQDEPAGTKGAGRSTHSDDDTADISDFLAAYEQGDLQQYAQSHNSDAMEFDANVTGVGPDALKTVGFLALRVVVDGRKVGPPLKLMFGTFSRVPFPASFQGGEQVHIRANIDQYFSDREVWLSPDDEDSYVRHR